MSSKTVQHRQRKANPCEDLLPLTLRAKKPTPGWRITNPQTLGEHVWKARLDMEMPRRKLASQLGVTMDTVMNWETGRRPIRFAVHVEGLISFLGYDPRPEGTTLLERVRRKRRGEGLTQKQLALRLGVHPSSLARLEQGGAIGKKLTRVCREYVEEDSGDTGELGE